MGKRAVEHFRSRGVPIFTEAYGEAADVSIGDCFSLSKQLAKAYLAGELDEICVAFTNFVSVLTQTPAVLPLLPLSLTASSRPQPEAAALYEPDPQTVFETPSSRSIWAAWSMARCVSLWPVSWLPGGLLWMPPPRTPMR